MAHRFARAWAAFLVPFASAWAAAVPNDAHYLGAEVCALCHTAIAATQSRTAMAQTWQTGQNTWLAKDFQASFAEGPKPLLLSWIRRLGDQFIYATSLPGQATESNQVEAMVGGKRHGVGFLTRVSEVHGVTLERPTLVQARSAWSVREGKLVLAPGCPEAKPSTYQTAFGLPLSPEYERRCLECHGQPHTLGAGANGGVQCETCHGPGSNHLKAVSQADPRAGILNPKRWNAEDNIAVCAQCHVGLTKFSDPEPTDLLVANQVVALKSSECYIQSRKQISCSTCHNPHEDAPQAAASSERACLGCHSTAASPHAATCPVNAKTGCLSCHMPGVDVGPFHLVDHMIRVHPEQQVRTAASTASEASQFPLVSGFFELWEHSGSDGRPIVTYLGRTAIEALERPLQGPAASLKYGQSSATVQVGNRSLAIRRMPSDFQGQAARITDSAEIRLGRGDLQGALVQSREALSVNPHSLRALVIQGRALSEGGEFATAVEILKKANALYPDDANAAYNLGRNLGKLGRSGEAIGSYRRAIANDPDLSSAYANLGMALLVKGDVPGATEIFRQGLRVDPLNAFLYRRLSSALEKAGKSKDSRQALQTAEAIEARIAGPTR